MTDSKRCNTCRHWYSLLEEKDERHHCQTLEFAIDSYEDRVFTSPDFGCVLWEEAPQAFIDSYPVRVAEEEAYAEERRRNAPPSRLRMVGINKVLQEHYTPWVREMLEQENPLLRALKGASPAATGAVRYARVKPDEEDPK